MNKEVMMLRLKEYWKGLTARERMIVRMGSICVVVLLAYMLVYAPLQNANTAMASNISSLRSNLVWLREQARFDNANAPAAARIEGENDSVVAILERSARSFNLAAAITQLTPGESANQVRVVLEDAEFSNWIKWVVVLQQQYGVSVQDATVERQEEPNIAEVRMTLVRGT